MMNIQSKIPYILGIAALVIMTDACKKQESEVKENPAHQLYSQSVELLHKNIEIIKGAKSQKELDSLYTDFENQINTLNLSYPPETDFKMTEIENDSLAILTFRLNHLRDSLKSVFTSPLPPDTLNVPQLDLNDIPIQQ